MFKFNIPPYKKIHDAILSCQENEKPYVKVIEAEGLFINPRPPRINLDKKDEWHESGRISPNAWRLEVDDDIFSVLVKKKKL